MVNIFNFSYGVKLFSLIVLVMIRLRQLEEMDFLQGHQVQHGDLWYW